MMQAEIFQRARFLIVDDETANVSILTKMLEKWDATQIVGTTDSCQTAGLVDSFKPDIILLDLMMPYMDGFGVMKQLEPHISPGDFLPILVLTADNSDHSRRRALRCGAADFLTKPFDAVELSLRVQNLLTTRFLHCHLQARNQVLDRKVQERTEQLEQAEIDSLECLALAAEYRDDQTGQHTQRVARIAALIARELGLDEEHTALIQRAASLHDVGKIGVADNVLLKPGKLSSDEFEAMKKHTTIGSLIMAHHHTPLLQLAARIALTHHERWDGRGYPCGLVQESIPLEGRIVAIADVFDALTHERPYKAAWPFEKALDEIARQSGNQFDPDIVRVFLTLPIESFSE